MNQTKVLIVSLHFLQLLEVEDMEIFQKMLVSLSESSPQTNLSTTVAVSTESASAHQMKLLSSHNSPNIAF